MADAAAGTRLTADRERVRSDLRELAAFGAVEGGAVTRLAFTPEDVDARAYVVRRMEDAGLDVRVDAFGNVFGRRAGRTGGAAVATGSHVDGPPLGGILDGNLGVIGGLECVRMLDEAGVETDHPIDVAIIAAEHLDRFGLGCLGSRALSGKLRPDDLRGFADRDGITIWAALEEIGLAPDRLESVRIGRDDMRAFLELHIEQGPVLDKLGQRLGVVSAISGPTRMLVSVRGESNHSGGTPMTMRRDAFAAAAEVVLAVEAAAAAESEHGTVGTVGTADIVPGSMVAVPGAVTLGVDIRGVDMESKRRVLARLRTALDEIADRRSVEIEQTVSVDEPPVPCSGEVIEAAHQAAAELGVDARLMPSGGGHDAQHIGAVTEAGMIFVPSIRGISHAPEEDTDIEDICLGIEVLAGALVRLARGEGAGDR